MNNNTASRQPRITAMLSLGVVCFAVWLLLSGFFDNALLLTLGVLSCVLVVFVTERMRLFEHDNPSLMLSIRFLTYLPWLVWEIVKANIDVVKCILDRRLPIGPRIFRTKASQKSDLGKVIYANSITLTPGTISIRVDDDEIEVHALTKASADGILGGEMDRRVAAIEDRP